MTTAEVSGDPYLTRGPDGQVRWRADYPGNPNVAQARAHASQADEVLFGGGFGGGKSDWLIAEVLKVLLRYAGANALILRRTHPELTQPGGIQHRLTQRLPASIARQSGPTFNFTNGSTLLCGHLNGGDKDLRRYLGGEYAVIAIDQAEDFEMDWIIKLGGRIRISGALRELMAGDGFRGRLLLTANPGGRAHNALQERYIDPYPKGGIVFRPLPTPGQPNPRTRAYFPATVMDNIEHIGEDYKRQLDEMDDEDRRAAYGDWTVRKGSRFKTFSMNTHVVDPEEWPLPLGGIRRARAIDFGIDHPFVCVWGALLDDWDDGGMLIIYRELVRKDWTPDQQAKAIAEIETATGERGPGRPLPGVADPSCWRRNQDISLPAALRKADPPPGSVADHYIRNGINVIRADNRRIEGAAEVARRLRRRPDGLPRVLIYSTCTDLIRTLPAMMRDPKNPEDVLKVDGDDSFDAFRYLSMYFGSGRRPMPRASSDGQQPRTFTGHLPAASLTAAAVRTAGF